jgi:Ubiquitin carboxyl-terminal hydrolase
MRINFVSPYKDLKRFSELRFTKLTNIVEFPQELDLTPYASESMDKSDPQPIYRLYGVSNHMGKNKLENEML